MQKTLTLPFECHCKLLLAAVPNNLWHKTLLMVQSYQDTMPSFELVQLRPSLKANEMEDSIVLQ